MGYEVIGDATDRIHRVPQITPAITVEIHRPPVKAGGHELTQSHGTGIGPLGAKGSKPSSRTMIQIRKDSSSSVKNSERRG